jgi:hypothetical protein
VQAVLHHLLAAAYFALIKSRGAQYEEVGHDLESRIIKSRKVFLLLQPYMFDGGCTNISQKFLPVELLKARRNPMFQWFIKKHWDYWLDHQNEYTEIEGYTAEEILKEVQKEFNSLNFDSMFGVIYSLEYPQDEERERLLAVLVKAALSHYCKASSSGLFFAKTTGSRRLQSVNGKSSFLRYIIALIKCTGPFLVLSGVELRNGCSIESAQAFYTEMLQDADDGEKEHLVRLIQLLCPSFEHDSVEEEDPIAADRFNTIAVEHTLQYRIVQNLGEEAWNYLSALHLKLTENICTDYFTKIDATLPSNEDIATLLDPQNFGQEVDSVVPMTLSEECRIALFKFIWTKSHISVYRSGMVK